MATVRFLPDDRMVSVAAGTTILEAARLAEVIVESPCNGTGKCGKCKVKIAGSPWREVRETPSQHLSKEEGALGFVLACHTEILGDLTVERTEEAPLASIKVLDQGESLPFPHDPFIRKEFIGPDNRTLVFAGDRVLSVEEGDTRGQTFGLVVDLGTTTLVASLIDLTDGRALSSASSLNPQSLHAQDVLSRIKLAATEEGLRLMHGVLAGKLRQMTRDAAQNAGISTDRIYEVVYSGNTCMLHLALKMDPHTLGRYPYTPALWGDRYVGARREGLEVAAPAMLYLPPIVSGFVGADITSGIIATRLHERKGVTLFIDIGTNGEMVLATDGLLSAASAAAGPAFEGMNVTCGMRAGDGAIEQFEIGAGGAVVMRTVGNAEPRGICGSGLLDIVGELLSQGVISREGRLAHRDASHIPRPLRERLVEKDGRRVFSLTDAVYLSQEDIRQVQLAKGAIRTGVEFLLRHAGLAASDVDEVLVAGAFGCRVREKSLIGTGLLPEQFSGKIRGVGNTSQSGGTALLLSKGLRAEIRSVAERIRIVELAGDRDFDRAFVKALAFDAAGPPRSRRKTPAPQGIA